MARTKRYFAAVEEGIVYFRASISGFAFKALRRFPGDGWGFTSAPKAGEPKATEVTKEVYNTLVAAKTARIQAEIAAQVASTGLPAGRGWGSAPGYSWCVLAELPVDVQRAVRGVV